MTIDIEDLKIFCSIGLLDHERKIPQELVINASFAGHGFIDYASVREFLLQTFRNQHFDTLENAQSHIAKAFFKTFQNSQYLNLKLTKTSIFQDCKVSVQRKWDNVLY